MGCSASKVPEDAPVLTKVVEAQAALPKALSAEDVDAMWAKNCGSDSPASDEAAGGGDGGGVMSGVKAISCAAADGAALVKAGVASGLQAVFGEEMDKSDAGPDKAKGGIGSVVDAGVDATVGGVKAIGDGAAYLGQKSLEGFGAIGDAIKANPLKAFGIGAAATGATVLAVVTAPVTLPAAAAVTVVVGAHATVAAAVGVGAAGGAAVVVGAQHGASGSSAADSVAAAEHTPASEQRFRQSEEPPTPPPRTGRPSRIGAANGGADVAGVLGAAVGGQKAIGDGAGVPHRDPGNPSTVLDGAKAVGAATLDGATFVSKKGIEGARAVGVTASRPLMTSDDLR
jgi:hypothetical protein